MMQKHSIYGMKLKASLHRHSGYGGKQMSAEENVCKLSNEEISDISDEFAQGAILLKIPSSPFTDCFTSCAKQIDRDPN